MGETNAHHPSYRCRVINSPISSRSSQCASSGNLQMLFTLLLSVFQQHARERIAPKKLPLSLHDFWRLHLVNARDLGVRPGEAVLHAAHEVVVTVVLAVVVTQTQLRFEVHAVVRALALSSTEAVSWPIWHFSNANHLSFPVDSHVGIVTVVNIISSYRPSSSSRARCSSPQTGPPPLGSPKSTLSDTHICSSSARSSSSSLPAARSSY